VRTIRYILTVALVSGSVLYFTLPTHNAGAPGACDEGDAPLTDLAAVRLYGAGQGDTVSLLAWHAASVPGAADSFPLTPDARPWTYWITTLDLAGNESCPSNCIQLNGSADVSPQEPGPNARYYDVAGRRVSRPSAPGIYFWRDGPRSGRVVVLR